MMFRSVLKERGDNKIHLLEKETLNRNISTDNQLKYGLNKKENLMKREDGSPSTNFFVLIVDIEIEIFFRENY